MRICVSHTGDPTHRLEFSTDTITPAIVEAFEDFKCQCEALFQSAQETAQFVYQYAAEHRDQLSIAIDFIPGVANVRAGVELLTGHDYVTGEDVSRLAAAANFIPGRRALEKVSPCLGFAKKSKKVLTHGKKGRQLKAGAGFSEKLASGEAVRKIERGRFTTVTTYADGTVRRAMNVDVVNEHLKSLTKGKDPILKRMTGDHKRTQGTVTYKVERDSGCLREGHCINHR
jgi:hypothetical protein